MCGISAECGLVFPLDYGECAQDVLGVFPRQAVEMEVECVESGTQVAAFLFIPDKWRAIIAEVAGEGCHVVRGVREAEHMVADEIASGYIPKSPVIVSR